MTMQELLKGAKEGWEVHCEMKCCGEREGKLFQVQHECGCKAIYHENQTMPEYPLAVKWCGKYSAEVLEVDHPHIGISDFRKGNWAEGVGVRLDQLHFIKEVQDAPKEADRSY